jgi:hypothetical protein
MDGQRDMKYAPSARNYTLPPRVRHIFIQDILTQAMDGKSRQPPQPVPVLATQTRPTHSRRGDTNQALASARRLMSNHLNIDHHLTREHRSQFGVAIINVPARWHCVKVSSFGHDKQDLAKKLLALDWKASVPTCIDSPKTSMQT